MSKTHVRIFNFLKPNSCLYELSILTFSSSTFCLQDTFTCFVCISEQRKTFSLCCIIALVFITEIYCAVRPLSLNKADYVLYLKG